MARKASTASFLSTGCSPLNPGSLLQLRVSGGSPSIVLSLLVGRLVTALRHSWTQIFTNRKEKKKKQNEREYANGVQQCLVLSSNTRKTFTLTCRSLVIYPHLGNQSQLRGGIKGYHQLQFHWDEVVVVEGMQILRGIHFMMALQRNRKAKMCSLIPLVHTT